MANKIDWYRVVPTIIHVLIILGTFSWFLFQFDKRIALQDQTIHYLQLEVENVQEALNRNHMKDHQAIIQVASQLNRRFEDLERQIDNLDRRRSNA